ncbi:MAG: hypothetical protein D6714_01080 [Bacteroidetes bacterium]|nr:MAG: hypothetical protein D6714_01080 [Bacteroidota bacterium]
MLMQVRTLSATSVETLEAQINHHLAEGFRPTLGIVFSSVQLDLSAICDLFDQKNIDLFGCSTAGEILNDQSFESSAVGLLFDLNPEHYRIQFVDGKDLDNPFEVGKSAGLLAKNIFEHPALIVGSGGVTIDAEQIVFGLKDGIGREVPMFGGLAGDDLTVEGTYAFSRNGRTDNGLVLLVLDTKKVSVKGMATSGWEAVGVVNTITKARGNVVYSINNEPALDVFIRYFGYFDDIQVRGREINTMSAQYPLQILREDGTSVLRSPLVGSEEERTLVLAGGVREGDKFRFSISPGFEVIDKTIEDFGHLNKEAAAADALILFSCKGRHAALGPLIEDEIQGIYNYWKVPMAGFFTYGEIGPTKNGACDFHNETCSLVVLKEK